MAQQFDCQKIDGQVYDNAKFSKDPGVTSMDIRQLIEQREAATLSPYACLSSRSRGRMVSEPFCSVRTVFQVDRDRILHSKSFRRLKHKTQVFLSPEGDHYRTRLTHTLEVSQIARTVARALALNEDLTEAIALGHDLGHTPFGHAGERVLARLVPGGVRHVQQSLRVVDVLEKDGRGLNLCEEVRDGIQRHSKGEAPLDGCDPALLPKTLEGQLVRIADIVAYVNHDLDDALRAGLVCVEQIPADLQSFVSGGYAARINAMVRDLIEESLRAGGAAVAMSKEMTGLVVTLRAWLGEHVYRAETVHREFLKGSRIIEELFRYFCERPEQLAEYGGAPREGEQLVVAVADFIAGRTDRYAINLFSELFLPQPWRGV